MQVSTLICAIISLLWRAAAGVFLESWKIFRLSWLFLCRPIIQTPYDLYPRRGPRANLLGEGDHPAQGGLPHQREVPRPLFPALLWPVVQGQVPGQGLSIWGLETAGAGGAIQRAFLPGGIEIDFVLQYGMEIIPVEGKGGEDKSASSFKRYIAQRRPEYVLRFSKRRYCRDGAITNQPLYLARKTRGLPYPVKPPSQPVNLPLQPLHKLHNLLKLEHMFAVQTVGCPFPLECSSVQGGIHAASGAHTAVSLR